VDCGPMFSLFRFQIGHPSPFPRQRSSRPERRPRSRVQQPGGFFNTELHLRIIPRWLILPRLPVGVSSWIKSPVIVLRASFLTHHSG
jgi:hypothetical protein